MSDSACWPPAGNAWASPASGPGRCSPCRSLLAEGSPLTGDTTRYACSRNGPPLYGPGSALTDDVAPVVGEICRRLDGLPLAIELAAARVDVLSVTEIRDRLADPLRWLHVADRDGPDRHRSLEAALAWGHQLLTPDEAALFARLSVFVVGFTLPAVETVCSAESAEPQGRPDGRGVFELLASLVGGPLHRRGRRLRSQVPWSGAGGLGRVAGAHRGGASR